MQVVTRDRAFMMGYFVIRILIYFDDNYIDKTTHTRLRALLQRNKFSKRSICYGRIE